MQNSSVMLEDEEKKKNLWKTEKLQQAEVSDVLAGFGETINSLAEVLPGFSSFSVLLKEKV